MTHNETIGSEYGDAMVRAYEDGLATGDIACPAESLGELARSCNVNELGVEYWRANILRQSVTLGGNGSLTDDAVTEITARAYVELGRHIRSTYRVHMLNRGENI